MNKTIENTKKALAPLVKQTPLTDKLLSRPPFKYLHNLITEIITRTNYANDIFSPDELVAENITEKESKIAFLNKIISRVENTLNQQVEIKANKIVAGKDSDLTILFLQQLVTACQMNQQSLNDSAVITPKPIKPEAVQRNLSADSNKYNTKPDSAVSQDDYSKSSHQKEPKIKEKNNSSAHSSKESLKGSNESIKSARKTEDVKIKKSSSEAISEEPARPKTSRPKTARAGPPRKKILEMTEYPKRLLYI
ncbi:hypothetical protein ROZALSC1DRAFT_29471 [Rozella allomycis CSF55]|uniref:TRAF3-interacting protein 1 N-terminal domain-containing protein n=1 Tax=Rozella allomycis (strain CSF55) TaxID=988480 RepID=A0A4P9YHK1_ROZAC|nr:hypothetical protein ROZALSC1DRAFT_29471 [Rozella allomycis CSF55]